MRVLQAALVAAVAAVPTVEIAPGVHMPMISLGAGHTRGTPLPTPCLTAQRPLSTRMACLSGTWQYNSSLAESVVSLGLKLGFTHIDTANDYKNQDGVGRALASHHRSRSYRRNATPCPCPCPEPSQTPTPTRP